MNLKVLFLVILGIIVKSQILSIQAQLPRSTTTTTTTETQEAEEEEEEIPDYEDVNSKRRKSEIFDQILEGDYDSKVRPPGLGFNGSGPVTIKVSMYIRSIENIDDIKMEYTVQMTYRQEWIDPRIKYSHIQKNVQYLQLVKPERIWTPDIFFSNEKTSTLHDLMVPNLYTRIYPNGLVLQSYRVTLLLNCPMNLHTYPLDVQICPLRLASYGWTTKDLVLKWREWGAVELAGDFYMARFELKNHFIDEDCSSITNSGNYSCIKLYFTFDRQFGFYLIQVYIPCALLVIISWVSFWLEPTAAEARVSLGVTTILAIVTETHGINESVPPASYIKALDVWTAVCQAMVFAALLQFSYVNYMAHFHWKRLFLSIKSSEEDPIKKEERLEKMKEFALRKAKRVDHLAQILFPLTFLLFNIGYWTGYLLADNTNKSYAAYVYPFLSS